MRTYGVEEELLLVDADSLQPLPAGASAEARRLLADTGHEVTVELQQEQLEVISPPRTTLAEQLDAIRTGRALGAEVAARLGGRVIALPTAAGPVTPHLTSHERYGRMARRFGLTAAEQLTNGFHVHVLIDSREEGVAVLDRIRVWLPTVLALSANSPFWQGVDTGYASYRHQAWSRWPTAGPTDVFGSVAAYDRHRAAMLDTRVPLDPAMLYFDARLAEKHPTVEVRVADVCLHADHAAMIATLVRALVETAARAWRRGEAPADVPASVLTLWSWQASHCGVNGRLIDPATGKPAPAGAVVAQLLEVVAPVLTEYEEQAMVEGVLADILERGSGARFQREAYAVRQQLRDVMAYALAATHAGPGQVPPR